MDLHVYPVIALDARNETRAVAPPFPLHSGHDENILRVCSQRRQAIYDATSLEREEEMRARLRDAGSHLHKVGFVATLTAGICRTRLGRTAASIVT